MIRTLIIGFTILSFMANGQVIKKKIGTAIWKNNNGIVLDSTLYYICTYDTLERLTSEWKVEVDDSFKISDTTYCEVDTADRVTYLKNKYSTIYRTYDEYGTLNWEHIIFTFDTIEIKYLPNYDENKILIRKDQIYNGNESNPILYTYKGRTTIEKNCTKQYEIIVTIKYNKKNQVIYRKDNGKVNDKIDITVTKKKYKKDGSLISYKKYVNGKIKKVTKHKYKDGREVSQTEKYYNPDYSVFTFFSFEFY